MPYTSTEPELRAGDLEAVTRAADGDQNAFALVVGRYRPVIVAACRAADVPPVDMDDTIQDAVEAVWHGLGGLRQYDAVSTWIYTVARHAALRSRIRAGRVPVPVHHPTDVPSTESVEGRAAARVAVHQALTRVPAPFREALVLRDLADWTYRDIGSALGISVDTVKSRIARGRANVRVWLESEASSSTARNGARAASHTPVGVATRGSVPWQ